MPNPTAGELAREFWRLMATNDFASVATVLSAEFVLEMIGGHGLLNTR